MTLAFIAGVALFTHNCRKSRIQATPFFQTGLILFVFGVVGARIAYILLFPEQFDGVIDYISIHEGGFVFYGGFIASFIALCVYAKIKNVSVAILCDFMAPSLALGHSIGRIGCFINDCCYGSKTDLIHIYKIKGEVFYRHPTQLYESVSLFAAAVFFDYFLKRIYLKEKVVSGWVACAYACFYAVFRFLIEFMRDDDRGGFFTVLALSPSQIISLLILMIAAIVAVYLKKKAK